MRWVGIGIVTRFECDGGGWGRVGSEVGGGKRGAGVLVGWLFICLF